ncbi:MAG: GNAT family N-acetyltransferase [Betaproteobacteria bacterium]|nr:GNAT family N-acetyltransferase [Betaproteobacteria bacterium]
MSENRQIKPVPWDKAAFGFDCFEIVDPDSKLLKTALATPGHYTAKVDPLADKSALHQCGFYYCDTLIEPWCTADHLVDFAREGVTFSDSVPLESLVGICRNAFAHGRFHRDFNIDARKADARYENWLRELHGAGKVYGLLLDGKVAGFIAHADGKLVLHAMSPDYRGQGLAKFFWSAVCRHLFKQGHAEVLSSISCANTAASSLYATLGFRFRGGVDIYHRMVP